MTLNAVLKMLRRDCEKEGGQRAWALMHDMQPTLVSEVLNGKRLPTDRMLAVIGVERTDTYRRIK